MVTFKDLVQETSTSSGNVDFTLDGVNKLGQTFFNAFGTGVEFDYFIEHATLNEWEVGRATLSDANTLLRSTVTDSSNNGAKVSFSFGTKYISNKASSEFLNNIDSGGGGVVIPPISSQVPWTRFVAASGDTTGNTDTQNLKDALSQSGSVVAESNAVFYINDTITLDPTSVYFNGSSSTFNYISKTGVAFLIDASGTSKRKEASAAGIENIIINGQSEETDSQEDKKSNIAFLLDTPSVSEDLSTSACFSNIFIRSFGVGIKFGDNAYLNTFHNVRIMEARLYGLWRRNFENSGENITFNQGVIFDSGKAFQWDSSNTELRFYGTSFDFNKQVGYADQLVEFYGCHFEARSDVIQSNVQFALDNGGKMRFIGGDIGFGNYNNGEVETGALAPADFLFQTYGNDGGRGGHFELIGIDMPARQNYRLALSDNPFAVNHYLQAIQNHNDMFNVVSDGDNSFSSSGIMFWTAGQHGGATINSTSTTALQRMKRTGFSTNGNASSVCWIRPSADQFTTSHHFAKPADEQWKPAFASGGFIFQATFGINDAQTVNDARMFIGIQKDTNTPVGDIDPAALVNAIGIAQLENDNENLYLIVSGNTAQAPIRIKFGTDENFVGNNSFKVNNTSAYQLMIVSHPEKTGVIQVGVKNLQTNLIFSHTIEGDSAIVPEATIGLRPILWRANSSNATPVGFDLMSMSASSHKPYETHKYALA